MTDALEGLADIFGELFGSSPRPAPRVVPVIVPNDYRGTVATQKNVDVTVAMACVPCRGSGCRVCEGVGWTARDVRLTLDVGPSLAEGHELPCPTALGRCSAPIVLRIFHPGAEADEWSRRQREEERALRESWTRARDQRRKHRRRALRQLALFVGAPVALVATLWARDWSSKARLNEPCDMDRDCRSHMCLTLREPGYAFPGGLATGTVVGHVCTEWCNTDDDCPSTMTCAPVAETVLPMLVGQEHDRMACTPRTRP